ncbi:unnamed protein product [Dicrocoelium dendriticum]|nr:unnamed protein product [Dicrocoelium dendriticum]
MFLIPFCRLIRVEKSKLRACHATDPFGLAALFISFARGAITSTLKSFLSSVHSPEGQGRLFSLVGVAEYCGMLVGLPGFAGLYGVTVSVCPGAVYFFSAGLILVTVALTLWLMWLIMRELSSIGQIANPLVLNVAQG